MLIAVLMLGPPVIFWLLWNGNARTMTQTIEEARR